MPGMEYSLSRMFIFMVNEAVPYISSISCLPYLVFVLLETKHRNSCVRCIYWGGVFLNNNSPQTLLILILPLLCWHYSNTKNQIHGIFHFLTPTRLQQLVYYFERTNNYFSLSPKQDVNYLSLSENHTGTVLETQ